MITPRYRGWRFVVPERSAADVAAGIRLGGGGGIDTIEDRASVRQAILLLLSTTPGERVMRPDYGCDLFQLVFSPNDDTTAGLAIHYVRRALERWEPRVEILRLDAMRESSDPHRLDVLLEYRLRFAGQADNVVIPLRVGEGA